MEGAGLGLVLLIVAAILAFWLIARSRTRTARRAASQDEVVAEDRIDVTRPTPQVLDFHVSGDEALVTFSVPLAQGRVDDVLADLLKQEAVEVVREKRHTLPIDGVTRVVALAGGGGREPLRVGEVGLEQPGELPPPLAVPSMIDLTLIGADPLDRQFEEPMQRPPGLADLSTTDELAPIGSELQLPTAIDIGLRALGTDPETMNAGELVTTVLKMFEYNVTPGPDGTYHAEKAGVRTYIRHVSHSEGGHPELDSEEIQRFAVEFQASKAARGMLVTEKFCPFEVYERERLEPRVRFVTRERLQKFIDAMALG